MPGNENLWRSLPIPPIRYASYSRPRLGRTPGSPSGVLNNASKPDIQPTMQQKTSASEWMQEFFHTRPCATFNGYPCRPITNDSARSHASKNRYQFIPVYKAAACHLPYIPDESSDTSCSHRIRRIETKIVVTAGYVFAMVQSISFQSSILVISLANARTAPCPKGLPATGPLTSSATRSH